MSKYPIHWQAVEEGMTDADVKVGTPATVSIGSDAYPAYITKITPCTIVVKRIGGSQSEMRFRQNARGTWVNSCYVLSVGKAIKHLDPSF